MRLRLAATALLMTAAFAVSSAEAQDKKELAFVVNGASDFWKLAEAGVKKAQGELPNYDLQFKYPEQAAAAIQQRLMDDLVAAGVDAIMVSAVDPKTSTEALNRVGGQVPLFTTDSDAPDSNRIAYIGSSNTDAGKQAGEIALKALPDGGKCIGFVGLPGADNARERIEGMKAAIAGSKVELIDVRGDDIDQTRAKRNVEDALAANPDIDCMVGFYSYNPPRIYEVLKEAGKLGQIKVIAFDEDPITLGGVREGTIAGTVVQQPYEWGYQGMKLMAKYLEGDKSGVPDEQAHHRADQDHRQGECRRVRGGAEGAHRRLTPRSRAGRRPPGRPASRLAFCIRHSAASRRMSSSVPRAHDGITKTYPGVVALDGVELRRRRRARSLGLIGENGAGKSTLMKILGGVVAPSAGTIRARRRRACRAHRRATRCAAASPSSIRNSTSSTISTSPPTSSSAASRCAAAPLQADRPAGAATRRCGRCSTGSASISAPDTPVAELSLAQMQLVEIAKALSLERAPGHHGRADLEPDADRDRPADARHRRAQGRAASASSSSRTA